MFYLKYVTMWIFLAATVVSLATGCQKAPALHTFQGETMGTAYTVKIAGALTADQQNQVPALLDGVFNDIIAVMSTYEPESELSRFNQHLDTTPFPASEELIRLFAMAREVSEKTGGAFDISVGPLVNAWGFGPDPRREATPTPEEVAVLLERIGYQKVEIDTVGLTLRKLHPEVTCDLSAIAKGYAVDRAAAKLIEEGYADIMVEVGGEVVTRGINPEGNPWRIAIEKPIAGTREVESVVPLLGCAMATSGDYRNFVEKEGKHYTHLIDPKSGQPVTHTTASVSVLYENCALADAYATAFMVLGFEKALPLAEREGVTAVFLIHDPELGIARATTADFAQRVEAMREQAATIRQGR